MFYLLIPAAVILGAWLYGADKVLKKSPPLPHDADTFTAKGARVGDIVTVALASVEGAPFEDRLEGDAISETAAVESLTARLTEQDKSTLTRLEDTIGTGLGAKFRVTATGLLPKGGLMATASPLGGPVPATIGILVDPPLSVRMPFAFMTASIVRIERDGKIVA
jgi:hypothetical protein